MQRSGPMACPVDGTALVMSERQNIEIDYCPTCRGVWLDRGELDKIIERAAAEAAPQQAPPPQSFAPPPRGYAPPQQSYSDSDSYRDHDPRYGHHRHGKKRKSFLSELFD